MKPLTQYQLRVLRAVDAQPNRMLSLVAIGSLLRVKGDKASGCFGRLAAHAVCKALVAREYGVLIRSGDDRWAALVFSRFSNKKPIPEEP